MAANEPETDPFKEALDTHEQLISTAPVDHSALFASLAKLEEVGGEKLITEADFTAHAFYTTLHGAYNKVVGLEVAPPLTGEERQGIEFRIGIFDKTAQATKPSEEAAKKPTDTNKIATNKRKSAH